MGEAIKRKRAFHTFLANIFLAKMQEYIKFKQENFGVPTTPH